MKNSLNHLLGSAFVYAIVGVLSGLFYRELTKAVGFPEGAFTQLGLAHTHLLVLGFIPFLIFMALERLFTMSRSRVGYRWFLGLYHSGLVLTSGMLIVHGTLTVLGKESNAMISGIAGLGHIALTAAFVMLYVVLRKAIKASPQPAPVTA